MANAGASRYLTLWPILISVITACPRLCSQLAPSPERCRRLYRLSKGIVSRQFVGAYSIPIFSACLTLPNRDIHHQIAAECLCVEVEPVLFPDEDGDRASRNNMSLGSDGM